MPVMPRLPCPRRLGSQQDHRRVQLPTRRSLLARLPCLPETAGPLGRWPLLPDRPLPFCQHSQSNESQARSEVSRMRRKPSTTPNRRPACHRTSMAASSATAAKKPSPEKMNLKQPSGRAAPKPPRSRSRTPASEPEVHEARATCPTTSPMRKSRRPLPHKPPGEGGHPEPGERRGRGPDQEPRVRRQYRDAGAGPEQARDWTNFDIGRVMRLL